MSSAPAIQPFLSVEEYLEGELASKIKHEYVDGEVYAMAGASRAHVEITLNAYSAIRPKLRGGPCSAYVTDLKVRLSIHGKEIFYYPDLVVGCDPRDTESYYLRFPKLIIEVLSRSTSRTDRHEKLTSYSSIPTLEEYLLVDQARASVILHRRRTGWAGEITEGLGAAIHLESVDLTLSLAQLYESVPGFPPSR